MKQTGSTLVDEMYSPLAVCLKALLGQWSDAPVTRFGGVIDGLLDIVDEGKPCHTGDAFREYCGAVAEKWSLSDRRSIMGGSRYTSVSFRHRVQIMNPNTKAELPRTFHTYMHLFVCFAPQHDSS